MSEIIRIIIRGESRIQRPKVIYRDRLTVTADTISYEYHPLFKTDRDPVRKWSQTLEAGMFEELCAVVAEILQREANEVDPDIAGLEFQADYEDGSKCTKKFWLGLDEFEACITRIGKMIPTDSEISCFEEDIY